MFELLPIIFLSLIQGLTEFLPISSSAHLILVPIFLNWDDQGLAMDVAVHVGTLIAVVSYFRKDVYLLLAGFIRLFQKKPQTEYSFLAKNLIYATIPVAIFGFIGHDFIATYLRNPIYIAIATIVFGLLLGVADLVSKKHKNISHLSTKSSVIIGFSQVLALIPGTSRSGITLTTGLGLGLTREAAARFSFLLAIPTIIMAGGYESIKIIQTPQLFPSSIFLMAIFISFISAYACISFFMRWISVIGVWPFVWYRLILGAGLLWCFA